MNLSELRRIHDDLDFFTLDQLRDEIARLDDELQLLREASSDEMLITSTVQERRRVENALARRNGTRPGAGTERIPLTRRVSEIEREEVAWLWTGRIPLGKLTLIEGDPGLGKSWLTLALAAAVSRGCALPGEPEAREAGNVILMNAEDGPGDTIRPRLEDMSADLQRVILLEAIREQGKERAVTLADLDIIEQAIEREKSTLVIVDPLVAFTAHTDTHVAAEVRGLLAPLAALAEKHKVAVLAVRHLTKTNGTKAAYRGQGSIDFLAACRSAFLVAEHPENGSERVLCHVKHNLSPKSASLTFSINAGRFAWGAETDLSADQLLAQPLATERTELDAAKEFLRTLLSDQPLPVADINKERKAAGLSERTLDRAKAALGIESKKSAFGTGWTWQLPRAPDKNPGTLRENELQEGEKNLMKSTKGAKGAEGCQGFEGVQRGTLRDPEGWEQI